MDFAKFTQDEFSIFRDLNSKVGHLNKRAGDLIVLLQSLIPRDTLVGESGFEVKESKLYPVIGTITSPLGNGQIVFSWSKNEREIVGLATFERECLDQSGRKYWKAVGSVKVPDYDTPTASFGETVISFSPDFRANETGRNAAFTVILAFLNSFLVH